MARVPALTGAAAVLTGCLALLSAVAPAAPRPVAALMIEPSGVALVPLTPDDRPLHPRPVATPSPSPTPAPRLVAAPVPVRPAANPLPSISAAEGVLIDLDSGAVLWSRQPRTRHSMASVTKIFMAMVTVNLMPLDRQVTVPATISLLPSDSTLMGLTPGETLTVRDLLDGSLMVSGNDAAMTLAQAVTTQSAFVADMNDLAARIGLHSSHFANPVGLDDPAQYSTPMDLAAAAVYLDRHYPVLAAIADTTTINIPASSTHKAYALQNLNRLLWTVPGVTGLKGGYTDAALGCLVVTATHAGHHLVEVVLGSPPPPSPGAFADARALLEYGYGRLAAGR